MGGSANESFVEREEAFHAEAREATGLEDFGDQGYRTGLGLLLESLDRDADLSATGRMIFRAQIAQALETRLRVEDRLQHLASVGVDPYAAPVARPIVITGLVRTGSTALHYLMGQDPDLQVLEYWLAAEPQPRPPREEWESHPDFGRAVRELEMLFEHAPSLMTVHEMRADWPEECRHVMALDFTDDRFEVAATLPTYTSWYHSTPHPETYRNHRRLVGMIGSSDPDRRWLLKYPVHLRQLPALLDNYPDACIVQTHRDPSEVVASYTSFVSRVRELHENRVDVAAIAREVTESWARAAEAGMAARDECPPEQFFDLYFTELNSDPIGSVRRIYEHFDQQLGPDGERQLEAWRAAHPRGEHGEHRYDAAGTGITAAEIHERFDAYARRFGFG